MSGEGESQDTNEVESENETVQAASSSYKVLGEFSDSSGAGVLGKNTAGSGTPIGVEGAVPNESSGYGLSTPHDARVQGTMTTSTDWRVDIDGDRGLELGGEDTVTLNGEKYETSGNLVVGHRSSVKTDVVGASVAGGAYNRTNSTALPNTVSDHFGTVSGGINNTAGDEDSDLNSALGATVGGGGTNKAGGLYATVAGGVVNTAKANQSTVGGGRDNSATGTRATIPGGVHNFARGKASFAAGSNADADHDGAFVWSDSGTTDFKSTGADQFLIDAAGGVGIGTNSPSNTLDVDGAASINGDVDVSGTVSENALTQLEFGSLFSVPDSTEKRLEFGTAVDEPGAWDINNYEYVAPGDGKYQVNLNIKFVGTFSSDTYIKVRIRASASLILYDWEFTVPAGTSLERSFSTVVTGISATAPFYFTVEQGSGGSKDMPYSRTGTNANVRYLGN